MDITFENLPLAVSRLSEEIRLLRQMISENTVNKPNPKREILNVPEVAKILRLHPTTVSQKLKRGEIPGKKKGKIWYIVANELSDYLIKSDTKSQKEIGVEVDDFLAKLKK